MHAIEGRIATAEASRYLQQLCKHWSHKFEVAFTPTEGRVPFPTGGVCTLQASADALNVRIEAEDAASTERLADVVFQHLQRFAFRAPLDAPRWSAAR
jgi:hypothetical protein